MTSLRSRRLERVLIRLVGGLLIAGAASTTRAAPSPNPPCHQTDAPRYASFEALPAPVPLDLARRFAPNVPEQRLAGMTRAVMAQRDADWNATDVVVIGRILPARRFIHAVQAGDRLLVWYESGGIAHLYHLAVFTKAAGRWAPLRHLAAGSLSMLCHRLESPDASLYDQYW